MHITKDGTQTVMSSPERCPPWGVREGRKAAEAGTGRGRPGKTASEHRRLRRRLQCVKVHAGRAWGWRQQ